MRIKSITALGALLCLMATASGCIEVHLGSEQTTAESKQVVTTTTATETLPATTTTAADIFDTIQSASTTDLRDKYSMPDESYEQTIALEDPTVVMHKTKAKIDGGNIGVSCQILTPSNELYMYTQTVQNRSGDALLRIGVSGIVCSEMVTADGQVLFFDETDKLYADITNSITKEKAQSIYTSPAFDTNLIFDNQEAIIVWVSGVRYVKLCGHNANGAGGTNIYYFNVDTGLLEGALLIGNSGASMCVMQYLEDPPASTFEIPSDFSKVSVSEISPYMTKWVEAINSVM